MTIGMWRDRNRKEARHEQDKETAGDLICPPAYMCKGPNRENFVSTGHKCGYCKGNGWFWGTEEGSREDVHVSCPVCGGSGELDAIITVDWKPSSK